MRSQNLLHKSIGKTILVGSLLVGLISGCDLVEQTGLLCNSFSESAAIEKVLADHAQIVKQVENVNTGTIDVIVEEISSCPGKGRLVITHATEDDRQKIEQLIDDNFFGIPYRMQNV